MEVWDVNCCSAWSGPGCNILHNTDTSDALAGRTHTHKYAVLLYFYLRVPVFYSFPGKELI